MREVKQQTIGSTSYTIQQLGAKDGRKVLTRLLKLVGPAAEAEGDDAFAKFAASLNDTDIDYLCTTFGKTTRFSPLDRPEVEFVLDDNKFDDHFAGKYGEMLRWLWACIEVNYSGFLSELGLNPADLAQQASSKMKSAVLTGASGGSSTPATDLSGK